MAAHASQEKNPRKELILALAVESLAVHDTEDIKLSSGRMSRYYVNSKNLLLTQRGREVIAAAMAEELRGVNFRGIGGLEVGAPLVATAYADREHRLGRLLHVFFVRKQPKGHGDRAAEWIEHPRDLRPRDPVVIIDDVVTTGGSLLASLQPVAQAGYRIVKVVAILDREEGGKEKLAAHGFSYTSLATLDELIEAHHEHREREAVA